MKKVDKLLWIVLTAQVIFAFGSVLNLYTGHLVNLLIIYSSFPIVMTYAYRTSKIRGILLIALAAAVGFAAEAISLNYVTLFGGHYSYGLGTKILQVPLIVILNWAVFICIGYWFIESFYHWVKIKSANVYLFSFATGLVVTAIDLAMDPIQVHDGVWRWMSDGPYFHIPTGNFLGWFGVTALTTFIYRKAFYKKRDNISDALYLLPVVGYLLIGIYFVSLSLKYNLVSLAVIGLFVTILPSFLNLALFYRYKRKSIRQ